MGVLSASVVVSFILAKIIMGPWIYFGSIFTASYWSLQNYVLFAHLADLSAILLIITSNNFSKRVLGSGWKSIQKLSYVYFYASSLYVFVTYDNGIMLISMLIVTLLTMAAFLMNEKRRQLIIQQ
jgi:DMSO/TMAO reductase YedYZ heme-binding membrane subunit